MSRLHFDFGCGSLKLAGALDTAPASTGLLIVSGGNELRSGAFSGQSLLAARIAKAGFPVFRFDRRGVGDSEGENRDYRNSAGDIRAALDAFRALAPQVERVFAFGNCDAASALMLCGGQGIDGLILSNPWTIDDEQDGDTGAQHTPEAIRSRYLQKLSNPAEIARLLRGGVNLKKLAGGLFSAVKSAPQVSQLVVEMRAGLSAYHGPVRFLIATNDRTGQLFESAWGKDDPRINRRIGAGHSYVEPDDQAWLESQILSALRG